MTYRLNGRKVTKQEWDDSPHVGMTYGEMGATPMINSRQAFISPIDGTRIATASQLRDHERKHKVIQVGDAYEKIVKDKQAAARENAYQKKKEADHYFKYH